MRRVDVFDLIEAERERQDRLKTIGRFRFTLDEQQLPPTRKLTILVEEVGEVARAIQEGNTHNTKTELVQVAALAVAWLEGMD